MARKLTWSKDVQFNRLFPLASRAPIPIEPRAGDTGRTGHDHASGSGLACQPAGPLSKHLDTYRDYIRSSAGEFSVAKEQYALLRSGWLSDRTVCYLAAGLPAIVQDTGVACAPPTGEGLLPFSTLEQAVSAFESVTSDHQVHAGAARAIAE